MNTFTFSLGLLLIALSVLAILKGPSWLGGRVGKSSGKITIDTIFYGLVVSYGYALLVLVVAGMLAIFGAALIISSFVFTSF